MSSTPTACTPVSEFLGQRNKLDSISSPLQSANAQLITVDDTTLNIPITVIIPITIQIQNAQICATVASSGDQTCTQIVLNPTQTGYTPVDINLSTGATPTKVLVLLSRFLQVWAVAMKQQSHEVQAIPHLDLVLANLQPVMIPHLIQNNPKERILKALTKNLLKMETVHPEPTRER